MSTGDSALEESSTPMTWDLAPDRNEGENLSCRKLIHKNFRELIYMLMSKNAVQATGRG